MEGGDERRKKDERKRKRRERKIGIFQELKGRGGRNQEQG